ncbi:hypothetical protein GEMRC1_002121 [Eukaryota sp. GEM-RC1]
MKEGATFEVKTVMDNSMILHSQFSEPVDPNFLSDWHFFVKNQRLISDGCLKNFKYFDAAAALEEALRRRPPILSLHDKLAENLFDNIVKIRSEEVETQKVPLPPTSTHVYSFASSEYQSIVKQIQHEFPKIDDFICSPLSNDVDSDKLRRILKQNPHFFAVCTTVAKLLSANAKFSDAIKVYRLQLTSMAACFPSGHPKFFEVWRLLRQAFSKQLRSSRDLISFIENEKHDFSLVLGSTHSLVSIMNTDLIHLKERSARIEKWLSVSGFYTLYVVIVLFFVFYAPPISDILVFWNKISTPLLALYLVRWPSLPADSAEQRKLSRIKRQEQIVDCALLITTHKSADIIETTLKAALKIFPPQNIHICDNGNSKSPLDNTKQVVFKLNPSINYHWIPVGNKTLSTWYTCQYFITSKYVLTTDDDVLLPQDLVIPFEEFDDGLTKCLAFTIRAENLSDSAGKRNLLTHMQDLEYKLAGLFKLFQSSVASCVCPHGALSLWERATFLSVLSRHNCTFHGEDLQLGLKLHELNQNFRIATVGRVCVPTTVPDHFLCSKLFKCNCPTGYSLLVQRIKSWDITAHRFAIKLIGLILFYWKRNTMILKPFLLFELWTVLMDWIRVLLLGWIISRNPIAFFTGMAMCHVIYTIALLFFNYWVLRDRHDLQSPLDVILLFPFYRYVLLIFRAIALVHNLVWYTPFVRNRVPIKDRNDLPLPPSWESDFKALSEAEENNCVIDSDELNVTTFDDGIFPSVLDNFRFDHSRIFPDVVDYFNDIVSPFLNLKLPAVFPPCYPPDF